MRKQSDRLLPTTHNNWWLGERKMFPPLEDLNMSEMESSHQQDGFQREPGFYPLQDIHRYR